MADDRQSTSAAGGARGYKRSWKNLLINKRYQLRFTLFMVAVSSLLMAGLGWWVMKVADEATRVQQNNVMSDVCTPAVLAVPAATSADPGAAAEPEETDDDKPEPVEPEPDDQAGEPAEPAEPEEPAGPRGVTVETSMKVFEAITVGDLRTKDGYRVQLRVRVGYEEVDSPAPQVIRAELEPVIEAITRAKVKALLARDLFDSELDVVADLPAAQKKRVAELEAAVHESETPDEARATLANAQAAYAIPISDARVERPVVNPAFMEEVARYYECDYATLGSIRKLEAGRLKILYVLIASCLLLTIGLAIYGIKMTHKVAGPLYKITLYMGKMRDGKLDKVYNLRKGDQLVDFYEHFKTAHAGVVDLEKADIAQLQAVIAAADGLQGKSAEVDAALDEIRAILARKEKSLE